MILNRRTFLRTALLPAAAGAFRHLSGQSELPWGGPVLDTHLHLRSACGCMFRAHTRLRRHQGRAADPAAPMKEPKRKWRSVPGCFVRSVRTDPASPDSNQILREALKNGAVSIGELKFHLALDSLEMRSVYEIAADLHVPVMMHIQVFPHFAGELPYNTGYTQFDKMLRAYPRTNFIGHGDLFWAHISADVPTDRGYPSGPIKKGGLSDRWLSDFPNLYADMSANSGNNALSRDTDFSREFIMRHKSKLIFGSDCSCRDGKGSGVSQNNNPEASRLAGKCVARETLSLLQGLTSPEIFRTITWENGVKLFKVPV